MVRTSRAAIESLFDPAMHAGPQITGVCRMVEDTLLDMVIDTPELIMHR
jgi:hypothetical protein